MYGSMSAARIHARQTSRACSLEVLRPMRASLKGSQIHFCRSEITDKRLGKLHRGTACCTWRCPYRHVCMLQGGRKARPAPQRAIWTRSITRAGGHGRRFQRHCTRERRPASPGQGQARTAARAARPFAHLPGPRRPAPLAPCTPHARPALASQRIRPSPQNHELLIVTGLFGAKVTSA